MSLGEYISSGSSTTKLLLHFNGNSNDSSGNGLNGSGEVGAYYGLQYGKFNDGVMFGGNNGNRIQFGEDPVLTNFTYLCWVYLPTLGGTRTIKSGYFAGSGNGCPQFRIESDGRLGLVKSYVALVGYSTLKVSAGAWFRVGVTYASGGAYKFYINGRDAGSGTNNQVFTQRNLLIGTNSETGNYYEPFNGYLDEFIIENRVWSPIEFQKDYTHGLGRFAIL